MESKTMKERFKTLCLKFLKDIKLDKTYLYLLKTKPFYFEFKALKVESYPLAF